VHFDNPSLAFMKCKLLLLLTAWALLLQVLSNAQVTFVESGSGLSTKVPLGTSLADFNADGFLDVLCFDGTTTNFLATLYQNSANLAFSRIPPTWPGNTLGATQTFWADDNGDGLLDLIMTGEDESRQQLGRIYWQNPDHTFTEHRVSVPGPVTGWRDLDNDGRFDVITGTDVNWKNPDGTYTRATVSPFAEIWDGADLDGDGDLDLLTRKGTVLRNDRNRRFVNTGVQLYSPLAVADIDGDGRLDLISNQPDIINGEQTLSATLPIVFQNHGSFNFSSNAIPAGAYYYKAGAVGELSGDAKPDLLIITTQFGSGFPPLVFVNTNDHFFPNNFTFPISANGVAAVMLADFDDDGDLDVLGIENEGRRRLFRNTSNLTRPLGPPSNLRAQPNRDQVHLFWDPDPSSGATSFNLRIGTTSGANDILSSESTASGRRLIPQIGNAQTSGSWNVTGLKPGLYFWSVQAVDWAFRGSAFAEEQTFTITDPAPLPPAPTISAINNVFTDEDTPVELSFIVGPSEALSDLQITIESSVPLLAPASNLQILGDGTNRLLRILPGTNQSGISTLTVRATDSTGQQASSSFILSVFPVNDPPFISGFPDQVLFNNSATLAIPFFASDVESTSRFDRLELSITSSNPNLLPGSSISFQADSRRNGTNLVISIPTNKVGSVTITITADDGEDQTSSISLF
jgi:hypothetical protein